MSNIANNTPLQFALRETLGLMKKHLFIIWLCAAVVILAIAGPFGTYTHFNFLERLAYWGICAPITFLIANFVATFIANYLIQRGTDFWPSFIVAGVAAGTPVGIFVSILGFILDPSSGYDLLSLPSFVVSTTAVTLPITLLYGYSQRNKEKQAAETDLPKIDSGLENFFARLPKHLGRDLIYLNAQDHYIKIVTSLGSEMILLRLSDAANELENFDGLRTHRSWWVAKKHISRVTSQNGKKVIELKNGEIVPISRSNLKKVEQVLTK